MGLFDKLSDSVKKVANNASQVVGNISSQQTQRETAQNKGEHTIYEAFSPIYGRGVKYVFTENSLIYGGTEYPYSGLSEITMVNAPQPLTNGVAQVNASGKVLTLAYDYNQRDRFAEILTYANEQINSAKGNTKKYKYILQTQQGTKLEVYEDYLHLYYVPNGMSSLIQNSMRGGAVEVIMQFNEVSIELHTGKEENSFNLIINYQQQEYVMTLPQDKTETAKDIIAYITEAQTTISTESPEPVGFKDTWKAEKGYARNFTLCGEAFDVTEDMDLFNTYRLKFKEYARSCTDCARQEFDKKVKNLVTYLEFFPRIYGYYMTAMCDKAMQILVAEGIWTVTGSSFLEDHVKDFHLAMDDVEVTIDSVALTVEQNQSAVSGVMSIIPNVRGGGFGLKGAIKGIAGATAFNVVRDSMESSLVNGAATLNQAQQAELYNRVNHDILFENVNADYWNVFISLAYTLKTNGQNIWWISDEDSQLANNIFHNISNPNFPQEQLVPVFIQILKTNPYNEDYIKFMLKRFGKTEETEAIKNYFGYTDLT